MGILAPDLLCSFLFIFSQFFFPPQPPHAQRSHATANNFLIQKNSFATKQKTKIKIGNFKSTAPNLTLKISFKKSVAVQQTQLPLLCLCSFILNNKLNS